MADNNVVKLSTLSAN